MYTGFILSFFVKLHSIFVIKKQTLSEQENEMPEPEVGYQKAGDDLLRDALKRSYKERFLMTPRLYKIHLTMQKAVITRKPYKGK